MSTKLGLEVLLDSQLDLVAGKRVGLVACPSSVDRHLRSSIELLHKHSDVNLVALFGPEHGIRGDAQAGAKVAASIDPLTQLPVHSLYGTTQRPAPEMLRGLDAIIIDLQDGGVRFYTFVATVFYVMEAARGAGISVVILDRPAPINGKRVEGPLLDPDYRSFVGPAPLPIRYGLTIGELARLRNERDIHCHLTMVPLQDWSRQMWYDETGLPFVPSSPNLPSLDAMTLYPGACLIEGTNLSEGRGTTRPFEYIGAPWINAESLASQLNVLDLPGARFRPVYFAPTFSKHQGELCAGVHVYVTDRERFQPVAAMLQVLQTLKRTYPNRFKWREAWRAGQQQPIDLLWGSDSLRQQIDADLPVAELMAKWQPEMRDYMQRRQQFLLYEER